MAERLEVAMLSDELKADIVSLLVQSTNIIPGPVFADLRLGIGQGKGAAAENMALRGAGDDYGMSVGIRVIAEHQGAHAPGYDGRPVGAEEFGCLREIIRGMLKKALDRAKTNAAEKFWTKSWYTALGESLWDMRLCYPQWPKEPVMIPAEYGYDPTAWPLEQLKTLTEDIAASFKKGSRGIRYSFVGASTGLSREFYANSFGVSITQDFALSQAVVYAASDDIGIYDVLGHQRGPEIFTEGINEPHIKFVPLLDFAQNIMRDVLDLSRSPICPTTEKEVTVVTDPHYNTLLVHEIVGHPTELDRGLKMETAYAGRTWLLKDLTDTMVGKRIGSKLLNAYSDPALPGFGHYRFDHEGVPARRVDHIVDGVFVGFMNSLQTSTIFGGEPNGHWKATDPQLVPLIRMSNTVFGKGNDDPKNLVRDIENGYYLEGHAIPSISESRENFRISARKVWRIEKGELTTLYKKGSMTADSRDYFMAIDGVGTDFRLYPIPNCGKGQPMQVKKLGNGGPTIRSRAKITGGA